MDMKNMGKYIDTRLKDLQISEETLLTESGMSREEYDGFRQGRMIPDTDKVEKMCQVLGIPLYQLTGDQDNEEARQHLAFLRTRGRQMNVILGIVLIAAGLVMQGISRLFDSGYGQGLLVCLSVIFIIYGAEIMMRVKGQK